MKRSKRKLIQDVAGLDFQTDRPESQEGSLLRAWNLWAQREGMLSSRRGLESVSESDGSETRALIEFRGRMLRHLKDGRLQRLDQNFWFTYDGTIAENGQRLNTMEARDGLYLAGSEGLMHLESPEAQPVRAGLPEADDMAWLATTEQAPGAGILPADSAAAYRVIWTREVAGGRKLLSAPSIPVDIVAGWLPVTWTSAGAGSPITITYPNHGLAVGGIVKGRNSVGYEGEGTFSAEVGTYSVTQILDANRFEINVVGSVGLSGTTETALPLDPSLTIFSPPGVFPTDRWELYRTKITLSADQPPTEEYFLIASGQQADMVALAGRTGTVHQDTARDDELAARLYTNPSQGGLSVAHHRAPRFNDVVWFRGHPIGAAPEWEHELSFRLDRVPQAGETITLEGVIFTWEAAVNPLLGEVTATLVSPTDIRVQAESYANSTGLGLRESARNLVHAVNLANAQFATGVRAFYTSGSSDLPGQVTLRRTAMQSGLFSIIGNSSIAESWPRYSARPGAKNTVLIGEYDVPEGFNRLRGELVSGPDDDEVLALAKLSNGVICFRKLGGVSVLLGESDGGLGSSFVLRDRSPEIRLIAPDTVRVVDNKAFALGHQGVVAVGEFGAEVAGHLIEPEILKLIAKGSSDATAFAYESERLYTVLLGGIGWSYNTLSFPWMQPYARAFTAGLVMRTAGPHGLLYLAKPGGGIVKERKTHTDSDYFDEDEVFGLVSVEGNALNLFREPDEVIPEGSVVRQGDLQAYLSADSSGRKVTLDAEAPWDLSLPVTITRAIAEEVQWSDVVGRSASEVKTWYQVVFSFEGSSATHHQVGFWSDIVENEEWSPVLVTEGAELGVPVEEKYHLARRLRPSYRHRRAGEPVRISQVTLDYKQNFSLAGRRRPAPKCG